MQKLIPALAVIGATVIAAQARAGGVSIPSNGSYASLHATDYTGSYFRFNFSSNGTISVYAWEEVYDRTFSCVKSPSDPDYEDFKQKALAFVNSESRRFMPAMTVYRNSSLCTTAVYQHYR